MDGRSPVEREQDQAGSNADWATYTDPPGEQNGALRKACSHEEDDIEAWRTELSLDSDTRWNGLSNSLMD